MKHFFIICMLCLCTLGQLYAQSGWTKKKGETYTQLSFATSASGTYYTLDEEALNTSKFRQNTLYLYSEYGLTDHLTLIANVPLLRAQGFETTETVWGIGDLRLDAKYGFLQQVLPIALSAGIEIPTAKANRLATNQDSFGNITTINLPTGDGEWNFWTTLAISQSIHPFPAYVNLSGSYNNRTSFEGQKFKDQWTANAQLGYQFFQKLWLQLQLGVQQSIGEPEGLPNFVRGDGTAYTQYGASLSYQLNDNWGLGAQYYNNADFIIRRSNVYESPTIGISVFFQKQFNKAQYSL